MRCGPLGRDSRVLRTPAALNAPDRPAVDRLKRNAAAASAGLVWSVERERLLAVYRDLPSPGP